MIGPVRPHLTVVLTWEALVGAAPARLDGYGPIPTSLVQLHHTVHSGRLRIQTTGGQFRFFTRHGQQLHDHRPQSQRIITDLTQQVLDLA